MADAEWASDVLPAQLYEYGGNLNTLYCQRPPPVDGCGRSAMVHASVAWRELVPGPRAPPAAQGALDAPQRLREGGAFTPRPHRRPSIGIVDTVRSGGSSGAAHSSCCLDDRLLGRPDRRDALLQRTDALHDLRPGIRRQASKQSC